MKPQEYDDAAMHGGYPDIEKIEEPEAASDADAEEVRVPTLEDLTKAIRKQPTHKHLYRQVLVALREPMDTPAAEERIAAIPEFKYAIQPQARFLIILEREGGIERVGTTLEEADEAQAEQIASAETPEAGESVPVEEEAADADEQFLDQADASEDVAFQHAIWQTTDLGEEYLAATEPLAKIADLFAAEADREAGYLLVMNACAENPKKLSEIIAELDRAKASGAVLPSIHPSIYVDRLEAAGAITWRDAWTLTDEGERYLVER